MRETRLLPDIEGLQPAVGGLQPAADLPPEFCRYRDEGCDLYPSCLRCPLSTCRYDESGGRKRVVRRLRDSEVMKLKNQGKGVKELAELFRVSRRTIQRIMRRTTHE